MTTPDEADRPLTGDEWEAMLPEIIENRIRVLHSQFKGVLPPGMRFAYDDDPR